MKKEEEVSLKLSKDENFYKLTNKELAIKYDCSKATIDRAIKLSKLKKNKSIIGSLKKYSEKKKPELHISKELDEIITGSMLGDGYIKDYIKHTSGPERRRNRNSSLVLKHGYKQEEYIMYKKNMIDNHVFSYIRKQNITDVRFKNPLYTQYIVETSQNYAFNKYRDLWYVDGKKIIPFNKLIITPLILAIWFQDDGFKTSSSYILSTNGFNKNEVEKLSNLLNYTYGLSTYIRHQSNNQYIIIIPAKDISNFNDIILPYIHESMLYKIIFK